jgi:thiol-disulfide isomerase/thioredoxin
MKLNSFCAISAVLSLACTHQCLAATPTAGQPAPPLTFTQLYGAPDGTKTDWPSFKGKVVVLEFWATWCAPCIAEIPHLNEFATSLAASNVQFISVDDEDPAVVKDFIAKKHMEGWVGVSKSVFDDYGVQARPTTIVIDTEGRIAAITSPGQLQKDQLVALAAGKPVVFAADPGAATMAAAQKAMQEQIAAMKNPAAGSAVKPERHPHDNDRRRQNVRPVILILRHEKRAPVDAHSVGYGTPRRPRIHPRRRRQSSL